jgi:acetamidase/formamidase
LQELKMRRRRVVLQIGSITLALGLAQGAVAQPQEAVSVHQLNATPETVAWGYYDARSTPVLRIESGDIVEGKTVLASAGFLKSLDVPDRWLRPEMYAMDAIEDRGEGGHLLVGPIHVNGAEPGDVLEVRVLDVRVVDDFAITVFSPGRGTLPEDFPYAGTKVVPLDLENNTALFSEDIVIPLHPFFGSMGVAPPLRTGRVSSSPPGVHAGNLDNKELTAGSILYIPVHVSGALFWFGDGHAGQGDGELAGTAIEASLAGRFQFLVRKDMDIRWPRAETSTHYMTMGLDRDLSIAIKTAIREMIDYLVREKGLDRDDAYMLASMTVDVRITQLVDGTLGIHAMLPKEIFARQRGGAERHGSLGPERRTGRSGKEQPAK